MANEKLLVRQSSDHSMRELTQQTNGRVFGYNVLHAVANLADSNEVGNLTTKRVGNRKYNVVGTLQNTFFNEPVGTAPSTSITSGSTSLTFYQRYDSAYAMADSDLSLLRPLVWLDSGGKTGFKQATNDDLNAAIDEALKWQYSNPSGNPGVNSYYLSQAAPVFGSGDSAGHFEAIYQFDDTRTDGSTIPSRIWKRRHAENGNVFVNAQANLSNNNFRPLYVQDSSNGNFSIREMTRQQQGAFARLAQKRIMESKIGTYKIRTSGQGAPTEPGTWQSRGSFNDTKNALDEISYVGAFADVYSTSYVKGYTATYQGVYTGNYSGGNTVMDQYEEGQYVKSGYRYYQGPFQYYQGPQEYLSQNYMGPTGQFYNVGFLGGNPDAVNFLGAGTYARYIQETAFAGNYTVAFATDYTSEYTTEYTSTYNNPREVVYTHMYITTYTKEFTGLYGEIYNTDFTTLAQYVSPQLTYVGGPYTGVQYTGFSAYDAGGIETGSYVEGSPKYGGYDVQAFYSPGFDDAYDDNNPDEYFKLSFIGFDANYPGSAMLYNRHTITPDYYPNYLGGYIQTEYLGTNYYQRSFNASYIGSGIYPVYTRPRVGQPSFPGWAGVMGFWASNLTWTQGYVPGDDSLDTNSYYQGPQFLSWGSQSFFAGSVRNSNPLYFGEHFVGAGNVSYTRARTQNYTNENAGVYYATGFGPTVAYEREYQGLIAYGTNSYQGAGGTYQQYYESAASIAGLLYASEGPAYVRDIGGFSAYYQTVPVYSRNLLYESSYTRDFGQLYTSEFEHNSIDYVRAAFFGGPGYGSNIYYASVYPDRYPYIGPNQLILYGEGEFASGAYIRYYNTTITYVANSGRYDGSRYMGAGPVYITGPDDHGGPQYIPDGIKTYERAYVHTLNFVGSSYYTRAYMMTGTIYSGPSYIGPAIYYGHEGYGGFTQKYFIPHYDGTTIYNRWDGYSNTNYVGGLNQGNYGIEPGEWQYNGFADEYGLGHRKDGRASYIGELQDPGEVAYTQNYASSDGAYIGTLYAGGHYIANYTSEQFTGDYVRLRTESYESIGSTVEYERLYVGNYSTDFLGFFDGALFNAYYESDYETDYIQSYEKLFVGTTIIASTTTDETYTLWVRVA